MKKAYQKLPKKPPKTRIEVYSFEKKRCDLYIVYLIFAFEKRCIQSVNCNAIKRILIFTYHTLFFAPLYLNGQSFFIFRYKNIKKSKSIIDKLSIKDLMCIRM